jgi:hypothetical protein
LTLPWREAALSQLVGAQPWRTMRWHRGQEHYSGSYWAATTQDHVAYESRLELSRLLFADFDASVTEIKAQPFLLTCELGKRVRRHVPDFLLLGTTGVVVVDVKPRQRLQRPEVASTLAWTKQLVESRGWEYEVWCEPDPTVLANVRLLAGFRRRPNLSVAAALRDAGLAGSTLRDAPSSLPGWPRPLVRAGVLHLLWTGELKTDLDRPLTGATRLEEGVTRYERRS